MSGTSADYDAPVCRSCYAQTLSKYERVRFWDEPITGSVYYCPEHQKVQDRLMARIDWSQVIVRKPGEPAPEFARVPSPAECRCIVGICSEDGECCESHDCPATEPPTNVTSPAETWPDAEGPRAHDSWACQGGGEWHWHSASVETCPLPPVDGREAGR